MLFRSTKGASKQRRDLINFEITQLRDLLPLPETARQRLSQLQIMSLACCYIRKSNYFSKLFASTTGSIDNPFEFFQAMSGFLLISTKEGKLLYISENVTEFLGHSMVDMMTQGDSIYDIIDKRDHAAVQSQLVQGSNNYAQGTSTTGEELTFFCRMNVSRSLRRQGGFGDHKVMHVRGHYLMPSVRDHYGNQPVFMGSVTPLVTPDVKETIIQNNTMIFQTVHTLDMKFQELSKNGEHHLGYGEEEVMNTSWYCYIFPEDIHEAKEKHSQLIKASHEMGCMLTIRLMCKNGGFIWVNIVMHIRQPILSDNGDPTIICINHVIDPSEASHFKIQSQLYSSHIARSPEFLSNPPSSSPPHTITQLTMEGEQQYQMAGDYGTDLQQTAPPGFYQAQFGVTTAPLTTQGTGAIMSNQPDTVSEAVPLHKASRLSSMSTSQSSNSGSGSDSNHGNNILQKPMKSVSHTELINRLKRKLPQQCKSEKKPKVEVKKPAGSPRYEPSLDQISFFESSPVIAPFNFLDSMISCDTGDQQMLVQMNTGRPGYSQLKKSIVDVDTIKGRSNYVSKMSIGNFPLSPVGPLSPESMTSLDDNIVPNVNTADYCGIDGPHMLTIDVKNETSIPTSVLTPEASPLNSPFENGSVFEEQLEQCVPSLMEEIATAVKKQSRGDVEKLHLDQKLSEKARIKLRPQTNLPELDPLTIDSYFDAMDEIGKQLNYCIPVKQESPSPPPSLLVPFVSSDVSAPVSKTPPPCLNLNQYNQTNIECSKTKSKIEEKEMFELGEHQLASIVANVAGSIMDMVQHGGDAAVETAPSFLTLPAGADSSINLLDALTTSQLMVSEIKQEMEHESVGSVMMGAGQQQQSTDALCAALQHSDLMKELHQFNSQITQAANSAPSYGDKNDLVNAFFNQNL